MIAPSVHVYTEQRTRAKEEHRAREQGQLGSRGAGKEAGYNRDEVN